MAQVSRVASRIGIRLMLFNLLLVFLPVGALLLLNIYEQHLEKTQADGMHRQARIVVTMLQNGANAAALRSMPFGDERIRVIDAEGRVVADTGAVRVDIDESEVKTNWLYRLGAAIFKKPLQWLRPVGPPLMSTETFERASPPRGRELQAAFLGRTALEKRVSSDRQVTLYASAPVYRRSEVAAAVLVSQTTDLLRANIHEVRLAIFRVFLASVVVAMMLTIILSTTIVQPLRQLRKEASAIADHRGRLRGRFKGSVSRDEIGDLSRALERLTRRLEQHQQSMEAFATDVSHEFKNPLASIRMATEMLAQVDTPAERSRFLRIAESEIARMETLLSQVREITMLDAEIQKEERADIDLNALLTRIIEGFQLRERDRVAFVTELASEPVVVNASEDRLLQVFENLLDNAVSFTPNGKRIVVSTTRDEKNAIVRVRDEGPGIQSENIDRIFDRFFTYRPDAHRQQRHTGLGLSIVKAIVEGYGGTASAENAADGGAVFEVRIPV